MKKIFLNACAILLIVCNCFSQSVEKIDYLQKSKNQKITAFILLGTGAAINIFSLATLPKYYDFLSPTASQKKQLHTSCWLLGIGSAAMLASIPFTISGHANKKKSASMSINTRQLKQLKNGSTFTVNYPAVTIRIKL
ncbi:MAG: hypothetical protein ABI685_02330 [Ferruginibacter sp.]